MARILIVEDETRISDFLDRGLRAAGHTTSVAADGTTGLHLALAGDIDLVVLDLGLPDRDGLEVLADLRGSGSDVPVIVLTARGGVRDTVAGLTTGEVSNPPSPPPSYTCIAKVLGASVLIYSRGTEYVLFSP